MKLDAQVSKRIEALLGKGAEVLQSQRPPPPGVIALSRVDAQQYAEWRSQALVCLTQVFGSGHTYRESFASDTEKAGYPASVKRGLGILRAALEDVEHGYLNTIRQMAAADVFSDFTDQAEYLLENDHWMPAVSLAGAVLENGLRSIATRNDVVVHGQDDLSSLNNKLADKAIYNNLRRKQVALWADVRNAVDHGRFDDVNESDGADLVRGVRGFLAEYL